MLSVSFVPCCCFVNDNSTSDGMTNIFVNVAVVGRRWVSAGGTYGVRWHRLLLLGNGVVVG